jgi:DNA polymerase-3 subunit epsilon
MNVLFFDTETTGFHADSGDKLVEIALLTYDLGSRSLVDKFITRIDPERSIPASAQAVHGITYESLVGMPKFIDIAADVHKRFAEAQLVVAHNLTFDATFVMCELAAAGMSMVSVPSVDTMTEARWATPDGKSPTLEELCFALGVPFERARAHGAEYDTKKLAECFFEGYDRGFYKLPTTVMVTP